MHGVGGGRWEASLQGPRELRSLEGRVSPGGVGADDAPTYPGGGS